MTRIRHRSDLVRRDGRDVRSTEPVGDVGVLCGRRHLSTSVWIATAFGVGKPFKPSPQADATSADPLTFRPACARIALRVVAGTVVRALAMAPSMSAAR